jgi:hypothetical protein
MKTYLLPIAIASLAVSALAGAQTPPTSPTSPSTSPSAPASTVQTPPASSYSNASADSKAQLKDCLAKQKASNPQISDVDAKQACTKVEPK